MGLGPYNKNGRLGSHTPGLTVIVYLSLMLLLSSCSKSDPPSKNIAATQAHKVLAVINGEPLYPEQFNKKFELSQIGYSARQAGSAEKVKELKKIFLNQLIEQTILAQEAKRRNITASEAELDSFIKAMESEYGPGGLEGLLKARQIEIGFWRQEAAENLSVRKLLKEEISKNVNVSEDEIVKEYKDRAEEFVRPQMVHALQILVTTENEAREVRRKLLKGADFSKLASQVSIGPEAKKGGDLGYFEKGVMPKEFDDVIFSLEKGRLSNIVKTPFGYHIFTVLDKRKGGKLKLEEVREKIRSGLIQEKEKTNYQRFIDQLKANSKLEIKYELID